MKAQVVGRIKEATPEAAREWLEGVVKAAELMRGDENLRRMRHGSDPLDMYSSMDAEIARAVLLLVGEPR